jgi:hypothetical protein
MGIRDRSLWRAFSLGAFHRWKRAYLCGVDVSVTLPLAKPGLPQSGVFRNNQESIPMKKISILQLILVAAMLVGATACKKKPANDGVMESAGESVDDAASDTADATEEAAEDTGDKVEEATDGDGK